MTIPIGQLILPTGDISLKIQNSSKEYTYLNNFFVKLNLNSIRIWHIGSDGNGADAQESPTHGY